MIIPEAGSIPYVLVRPPEVTPCDALAQEEMLGLVNSVAHAALLGISSDAILLITPCELAVFDDIRNGPAFFVCGGAGGARAR